MTFRRLSEIHGEAAGDDNEGLLLLCMDVTTTLGTWLVAPHVRARVFEPDRTLEFGDVTSWLIWFMRAGRPLKLLRDDDRERHRPHHTQMAPRSSGGVPLSTVIDTHER